MNARMKTIVAATAVSLGLTAIPASAQVLGDTQAYGYNAQGYGYAGANRATGYTDDGRLNVFGARIEPPAARGPGLIGDVTGAVGGIVGGATGVAGSVVGGAVGAANDLTTGSLGYRGGAAGYGARTAY